jgi:penicillin-binding protein 1C
MTTCGGQRTGRTSHHGRGWRERWLPGIALVAIAGGVAATGVWRWLAVDLPAADALVVRAAADATKIYDRHGVLLYEVLDPRDPRAGRRTRVALGDLPAHLTQAVVAVEDAGFYGNPGVDVRGVARAVWHLVRYRRIVSGGSTITQQLARQVLLDESERTERTVRRKLREMVLAVAITRRYPKDRILAMYLNEVYFGQMAYGVEAAARTYFGKPARELDLAESALLAGLIQSPATYNPLVDIDAARRRQAVVLDLMVRARMVSRREADLARAERLALDGGDGPLHAPHFVAWVRNLLEGRYGAEAVNGGGMRVVTTLDLDLQRQAEAVVSRRLTDLQTRAPGKPDYHASDAALVALEPDTGQVLAMVGSADYFDRSIDGAVNVALALRQPGSALKPITYATGFDVARWGTAATAPVGPDGRPALPFTPATVLSDVPTSFVTAEGEPYRPLNYDRMWHGPIPLRRALATSSNMVAVKVLDAVGTGALIETAESLGITTFGDRDRYGLALTLGGGEVRLLDLTAAYAGLANGGHRVTPNPILAVLDAGRDGSNLDVPDQWRRVVTVDGAAALAPQVAWLVTDILADDAARLPAFGEGSVLALGRPAAAKTGTTTDFRDNWTVGYTPDLAVGVWLGNADNSPMAHISGITGAGPIWHDFMAEAHRGRPIRSFARPDGLVEVEVCATSGLQPTALCRRRAREWFIAGTEPHTPDASYRAVAVDAATGLAWDGACRGSRVERVFRILPPDAAAWGRRAGIGAPPEVTCGGARLVAATGGPSPATAEGSPADASAGGPALVIARPARNATFALTPQIPRAFQQIDVEVDLATAVPVREVTLYVDDAALATLRRAPYRASWALSPGAHTVRAAGVDEDGRAVRSAPTRFWVVSDDRAARG